jgi:quercetin dioxygenase-like cupin family protein
MTIVRADARRTTTTPNATMTTLASPTQGGAPMSVWLVAMAPRAQGPVHAFDSDVVWTVTSGAAEIAVDGVVHRLQPGDTAVLAAGAMRQVTAGPDGMDAVAATAGRGVAVREGGERVGVPDWVA